MTSVKDRLRAACVGRPATIGWPHRLLHDAVAEIERLELRITEIESAEEDGRPFPDKKSSTDFC